MKLGQFFCLEGQKGLRGGPAKQKNYQTNDQNQNPIEVLSQMVQSLPILSLRRPTRSKVPQNGELAKQDLLYESS
jgi:hypothetical protein